MNRDNVIAGIATPPAYVWDEGLERWEHIEAPACGAQLTLVEGDVQVTFVCDHIVGHVDVAPYHKHRAVLDRCNPEGVMRWCFSGCGGADPGGPCLAVCRQLDRLGVRRP